MKRRSFLKNTTIAAAAPFILPSGRLFASTGARVANHVVFVLFAGGIRQQESVDQLYLVNQGVNTEGNIMNNMLAGDAPSSNVIYEQWNPILSQPLSQQSAFFKEVRYQNGPTGHYNGHTVAMTGNYTETGLNLNINPEFPTIFEYYRKHSDPARTALNAWWVSEGLGPYPSLNYSQHPSYGATYGANYLRPASLISQAGVNQLGNAVNYQPDDVDRINKVKDLLDRNFTISGDPLPGIENLRTERELIKSFYLETLNKVITSQFDWATPNGSLQELTGDLLALSGAWAILEEFAPELMVVNTTNLDICHSDFTGYIDTMHKADYGVGWLWNKIQSHPILANDTIMICMPEHGRNLASNNVADANGFGAYDHTGDENSRRLFAMIVGPDNKINYETFGTPDAPGAESIDIVPTIAHILGFEENIPNGLLPGRVLTEAFV